MCASSIFHIFLRPYADNFCLITLALCHHPPPRNCRKSLEMQKKGHILPKVAYEAVHRQQQNKSMIVHELEIKFPKNHFKTV